MNQKYPSALLENAVNELSSLPGVGRKTALRLALYILRRDVAYAEGFASALLNLRKEVKYCKVCHNICDDEFAVSVPIRNGIIPCCVVENIKDEWLSKIRSVSGRVPRIAAHYFRPSKEIGPGDLPDSHLRRPLWPPVM